MGGQFRVDPEKLREFADFARGEADKAQGPEDLAGNPVFGPNSLPGISTLAQGHYAMWREARKLHSDVKGGLSGAESGAHTVINNYEQADAAGAAKLRKAIEGTFQDWHPNGQGQQGQPGQGHPGQGQQMPAPPPGIDPLSDVQSPTGYPGNLPADPHGDGINQPSGNGSAPASPSPAPGGGDGGVPSTTPYSSG